MAEKIKPKNFLIISKFSNQKSQKYLSKSNHKGLYESSFTVDLWVPSEVLDFCR